MISRVTELNLRKCPVKYSFVRNVPAISIFIYKQLEMNFVHFATCLVQLLQIFCMANNKTDHLLFTMSATAAGMRMTVLI